MDTPPVPVTRVAGATRTASIAVTCVGLAVSAALLYWHARHFDFVSDDAYIVARYARNVIDGHGWVYNVGERVEGYTSFLWVAATALLGRLEVDLVIAVRALALGATFACLPLLFAGARRLGIALSSPIAWLAALLWASSTAVACWSLGGLEAPGYAVLVLLATLLCARTASSPLAIEVTGAIVSLCALMRPEGMVVVALLSAWMGWQHRRAPRMIAWYAVPVTLVIGAHLTWRRLYYGDWLPNTYYVKVGHSWAAIERGLQYLDAFTRDSGGLLVWVLPFVLPWLTPAPRFARLLSAVGLIATASVVAVGGDGLPMYRFMVPVLPCWALLVAFAVHGAWQSARQAFPSARRLPALILGITSVTLMTSLVLDPIRSPQYKLYDYQKQTEIPQWVAVGKWLAANVPATASIALAPIGAVGYYSNLHVYDLLGLTDRHIAHAELSIGEGWAGHEKHDGPYILAQKPTYLLLGNVQVTDQKLDPRGPLFLRPLNEAIRKREEDFFRVPELGLQYEPRIVPLPTGKYFHFLERRP